MQAIRVVGHVNSCGQLTATVPESVGPGEVQVIVLAGRGESPALEDDAGRAWMAGVAHEWRDDLADPREDIYTLEDGVPTDGTR